ncbi:MAG: hypothetical protein ACI35O_06890 [Bacillaceae bacterium]
MGDVQKAKGIENLPYKGHHQDETTCEKVAYMKEVIEKGIERKDLRDETLSFLQQFAEKHSIDI